MANTFKQIQAQPFILAGSGCAIGATSITLVSLTDIDGVALTMSDFGDKGFGTLEPGNGSQEEAITWTGVTQNVDGTATLTGVKHQLFKDPYTETSGVTKSHSGGTQLIYSNTAGYYQNFLRLGEDNTVADVITFTAPNYPQIDTPATLPTADGQFATKKYVDGVAIAGAPNASSTVKGITKLSSDPSVLTNPIALNSEEVAATTGANKVVRANASGFIDTSFIDPFNTSIAGLVQFFGDGADGDVTISTDTVLSSDKYYNNLTINSGKKLTTAGYRVFVKGTLTNNGTISANGNNGTNGSSPGNGGAGGTALSTGTIYGGLAGGAGGNSATSGGGGDGTAGASLTSITGVNGVVGGAGGSGDGSTGGDGGAAGTATAEASKMAVGAGLNLTLNAETAAHVLYLLSGASSNFVLSSSAASGGGGGGGGTTGGTATSGGGGGAGGNGGIVYISAQFIVNNGIISATGGNGGNGGNATGTDRGGGGGGAGGNGGLVFLFYRTLTTLGTINVSGGAYGTGGAKTGTGVAGSNGTVGNDGKYIRVLLDI